MVMTDDIVNSGSLCIWHSCFLVILMLVFMFLQRLLVSLLVSEPSFGVLYCLSPISVDILVLYLLSLLHVDCHVIESPWYLYSCFWFLKFFVCLGIFFLVSLALTEPM